MPDEPAVAESVQVCTEYAALERVAVAEEPGLFVELSVPVESFSFSSQYSRPTAGAYVSMSTCRCTDQRIWLTDTMIPPTASPFAEVSSATLVAH